MINDRHKRFIEEYLIDANGLRAYKKVYGDIKDDSAKESASRLLKKPYIIQELEKLQRERMERVMWTAEEILQEIKDIAHSEDASKSEKLKALELAAKSLGMFRDKVEHSGGLQIVLGQDIEEWAE